MLDLLTSYEAWISFATLALLEIVLGIDNIVFISILTGKLPGDQREKARKLGLAGAFVSRLGLLAALSWIMHLDKPLFEVRGWVFSGKSIILLLGGAFLVYKATKEIHHKLEAAGDDATAGKGSTFGAVIGQIILLDMVFSIDSVITAVGMTEEIAIMVAANVVALALMLAVGGKISRFVEHHPSVKMLALSFLLMIGFVLIAEGFGVHVPKGYIYGAMGFSIFVEMLNLRSSRKKALKPPSPTTLAIVVSLGASLAPAVSYADILSHDRLRAHVATMDVTAKTRDDLDTSRAAFIATALVPGWGTYRLEKIVFGEVRPAGIIGDWVVGGALPLGLAIGAYAADDPSTRRALAWTAAGLYAGTRLAILVIGNLHISAYREALALRFSPAPGGAAVSIRW